jgi:hypothetical protein
VAGHWQPRRSSWIPSISVGWGHDTFRFGTYPVADGSGLRTQSWYSGLLWSDVLGQGNSLGFAVGSPTHVMAIQAAGARPIDDRGLAYELYYRIVVSDELTLTPAVFWLTRSRGAMTASDDAAQVLLSPAGSANARWASGPGRSGQRCVSDPFSVAAPAGVNRTSPENAGSQRHC